MTTGLATYISHSHGYVPSDFPLGGARIRGFGAFDSSRVRRFAHVNCAVARGEESWILSEEATPYQILGVDSSCSASELKNAFRSRV